MGRFCTEIPQLIEIMYVIPLVSGGHGGRLYDVLEVGRTPDTDTDTDTFSRTAGVRSERMLGLP